MAEEENEVEKWLRENGFSEEIPAFRSAEVISMEMLYALEELDMKDMGIPIGSLALLAKKIKSRGLEGGRAVAIVGGTGTAGTVNRKRRWDQLNSILDRMASKARKIDKDSTAFSSVKWDDMSKVLYCKAYEQSVMEVPSEVLDLLYSQLLKVHRIFGFVTSGKEAKRLQFISPVLLEVCALFNGKVKISVEEDLKGVNIHTNGHFEYILEVDGRKVCVVVAKKDDMEKGIAQALLGVETIGDLENVDTVHANVTNYIEWVFLKNTDDAIYQETCSLQIIAHRREDLWYAKLLGLVVFNEICFVRGHRLKV